MDLKRGSIVQKDANGETRFFHVENINAGGLIDAIADDTGEPAGLNVNLDTLREATMAEVLAHRARVVPVPDYSDLIAAAS